MQNDPIFFIPVFIFGCVIGSFLNVVILRLPAPGESIAFPASHCPHCKTELSWYENIPLFSYLFLWGKCRHCGITISLQYPIVELSTGLMAVSNLAVFGLSAAALIFFFFSAALITIIWIDIHHQIIPDVISKPGIILGFLFSFLSPITTWQDSLIGLVFGFGIFFAISSTYKLVRGQEGLGGGDTKLLSMLGAFLGWQSLLFIIFASSLTGTIAGLIAMPVQKKGGNTRIAFGPFLAISGFIYLFFHEQIHQLFQLYLNAW
ncbi:MAG: prepilin peptidase [Proteobacteria bacterium]|nr:MAG: prepilin peptidase [Pseudomonadota bacterium]